MVEEKKGSEIGYVWSGSSDQDMILVLDEDREEEVASRLVFQAKGAVFGGERAHVQRYCEELVSSLSCPGARTYESFVDGEKIG